MNDVSAIQHCANCNSRGTGKYCSNCGSAYVVKRLSVKGLVHDVFHFFTHLDKGFVFTLKQLFTSPGTMQRIYVEGERSKHQQPFSMFFICATVAALSRYWIYLILNKYYQVNDTVEANFFHEYMVLVHIFLLPLYICISYIFFSKSKFNFAEIGVLTIYTTSFFFIAVSIIALMKFIFPHADTAYAELPVLLIYNAITLVKFFREEKSAIVILKSIVIMSLMFSLAHYIEKFVIERLH